MHTCLEPRPTRSHVRAGCLRSQMKKLFLLIFRKSAGPARSILNVRLWCGSRRWTRWVRKIINFQRLPIGRGDSKTAWISCTSCPVVFEHRSINLQFVAIVRVTTAPTLGNNGDSCDSLFGASILQPPFNLVTKSQRSLNFLRYYGWCWCSSVCPPITRRRSPNWRIGRCKRWGQRWRLNGREAW